MPRHMNQVSRALVRQFFQARELVCIGVTVKRACKTVGLCRSTYYRFLEIFCSVEAER